MSQDNNPDQVGAPPQVGGSGEPAPSSSIRRLSLSERLTTSFRRSSSNASQNRPASTGHDSTSTPSSHRKSFASRALSKLVGELTPEEKEERRIQELAKEMDRLKRELKKHQAEGEQLLREVARKSMVGGGLVVNSNPAYEEHV